MGIGGFEESSTLSWLVLIGPMSGWKLARFEH